MYDIIMYDIVLYNYYDLTFHWTLLMLIHKNQKLIQYQVSKTPARLNSEKQKQKQANKGKQAVPCNLPLKMFFMYSTASDWIHLRTFIKILFHHIIYCAIKLISVVRIWLVVHLSMLYECLPVSIHVCLIDETRDNVCYGLACDGPLF